MKKNIKSTLIVCLILFLSGICMLVFAQDEMAEIAVKTEQWDEKTYFYELENYKTINIKGKMPVDIRYTYGAEAFNITAENIDPNFFHIEESGSVIDITYLLGEDDYTASLLPVVNFMYNTTPQITVSLPENYWVSSNSDWNYNITSPRHTLFTYTVNIEFGISDAYFQTEIDKPTIDKPTIDKPTIEEPTMIEEPEAVTTDYGVTIINPSIRIK